jgi:hypothetical protein
MSVSLRRALVLLPLLTAAACHATRRAPLEPEVSRELARQSAVVSRAGDRVVLEEGRVTADSVVGMRTDGTRFALPRDSVALLEERRVSAGRTLGLAGGVAVGLLAALVGLLVAAGPGLP